VIVCLLKTYRSAAPPTTELQTAPTNSTHTSAWLIWLGLGLPPQPPPPQASSQRTGSCCCRMTMPSGCWLFAPRSLADHHQL